MKGITEINYVVKFILNFTDHLSLEQPIPFCGENEFYYKYTIHLKNVKQLFVYVNLIFYICIDTDDKVKSGLGEQPMELNQRQLAFIYNKGSLTFNYIYTCLFPMLFLYLFYMITIIYITFPLLIVWGFNVLNTTLGDIYIKLKTFLFDED